MESNFPPKFSNPNVTFKNILKKKCPNITLPTDLFQPQAFLLDQEQTILSAAVAVVPLPIVAPPSTPTLP